MIDETYIYEIGKGLSLDVHAYPNGDCVGIPGISIHLEEGEGEVLATLAIECVDGEWKARVWMRSEDKQRHSDKLFDQRIQVSKEGE